MSRCILFLFPLLGIILSCRNPGQGTASAGSGALLQKGQVVASDSMLIPDPLNRLRFSVTVVAQEPSKGVYEVRAKYGNNDAVGGFTMPRGGENLVPVLKKAAPPSLSYVIGFQYDGVDTSLDYFLVSGQKGEIEMKYIRSYSFQ